jgi:Subtilase family
VLVCCSCRRWRGVLQWYRGVQWYIRLSFIAGTIAASANNGLGLIGAAPEANLVAMKVLDSNGKGYLATVINSLQWVYNNKQIWLVNEVERIILHDAPWITQHHSVLEYRYQPYVQGVEISLLGKRDIPLDKIWLKQSPATSAAGAITNGEPCE